MTSDFHTPIPFAAPVASSVVNSPDGQLDNALGRFRDGLNTFNQLRFLLSDSLTIAAGVITIDDSYHIVDTEGSAASDDLTTINGGENGDELFLKCASGARVVTIKHNTGNIFCFGGADVVLSNVGQIAHLLYVGTGWALINGTVSPTFDSLAPTTTKGDLIVRNTTVNTRLAVGTNDAQIYADSSNALGMRWGQLKRAILTHDEANNTVGGASSAAAWTNRTLNTIFEDTNSLVSSLSSNSFVLIAGKYRLTYCESSHVANGAANEVGRLRLRNTTTNTTIIQGATCRFLANQGAQMFLPSVVFDANGTDSHAFQYYVNLGRVTNGLGIALNEGTSERYAIAVLEKIG